MDRQDIPLLNGMKIKRSWRVGDFLGKMKVVTTSTSTVRMTFIVFIQQCEVWSKVALSQIVANSKQMQHSEIHHSMID